MEHIASARGRGLFASLLSLSGRARRTDILILGVLGCLVNLPRIGLDAAGVDPLVVQSLEALWQLLWAYLWVAITVRRLHDQDISGWWVLLLLTVGCLLTLGYALQPQQDFGGLTVSFLSWSFHPMPGPATTALTLASLAWMLAILFLSFRTPTYGPNRYGPDPRLD
ncbi:MAG: DUF805 domain-containing protein [Sphingomonas sp.]|uniref:DUF805 domain-containing protein n=1 Tax=Sphingomonas sp. TaxID=28214 RepID=UPI0025F46694|nr:DUF805 domain-containing protein [Sphingomonas sp.]MBX3563720.1 DUF805 domain-containing protein [Sphingomonas sp.]